jgi:hypothetical protein
MKIIIIICVAIEDKKIWIMNNDIINGKSGIRLGCIESKYNQYEIKIEDLNKTLEKYYKKYISYHDTKENLNIPIGESQKKEHEYRLLRKSKINYLEFINPEIDSSTFDFTINNYKIQEKVAGCYTRYSKGKYRYNCYVATFRKHNGKDRNSEVNERSKIRSMAYKTYDAKDNDYYWINIENTTLFLLIPDEKMIEKELVNAKNKTKASLYIPAKIDASHWLYDYVYDYEKDNKEKLLELFN